MFKKIMLGVGCGIVNGLIAGFGLPNIVALIGAALVLLAFWCGSTSKFNANPSAAPPKPQFWILALGGAAALLVSAALPWGEPTTIGGISANTLLQSGYGWEFIALGIIVLLVPLPSFYNTNARYYATVLMPLAFLGSIYVLSGASSEHLTVAPITGTTVEQVGQATVVAPGLGHYVAGIGCGLLFLAGLLVAIGPSFPLASPSPDRPKAQRTAAPPAPLELAASTGTMSVAAASVAARATKKCPDCAEEVKAAARVCHYCGYRFDGLEVAGS
jgi:hypothetical protein